MLALDMYAEGRAFKVHVDPKPQAAKESWKAKWGALSDVETAAAEGRHAPKPSTKSIKPEEGASGDSAMQDDVASVGEAVITSLADALTHRAIRLIDVNWLLARDDAWRMPRRQALEALEDEGETPFVGPDEARTLLQDRSRPIGVLSYGWLTVLNPDPDGSRLTALRTALAKFQRAGRPVRALFWDFASLMQAPRSEAQHALFKKALKVMGWLYASEETCVLKMPSVPPRPPRFDGQVHLFGVAGVEEGLLWMGFDEVGATVVRCSMQPNGREEEALLTFETPADAERAVARCHRLGLGSASLAGIGATLEYNARPYAERGWCIFEEAVSYEVIVWAQSYGVVDEPGAHAKVYLVDEHGHAEAVLPPADPEDGPSTQEPVSPFRGRSVPAVAEVQRRIEAAHFTGRGDQQSVLEQYTSFRVGAHAAAHNQRLLQEAEARSKEDVAGSGGDD